MLPGTCTSALTTQTSPSNVSHRWVPPCAQGRPTREKAAGAPYSSTRGCRVPHLGASEASGSTGRQRARRVELQRPARARPGAAVAFYQAAFGWQTSDLGYATMIRQPGYGDHLEATVDPDIRARQSGDFVPPGVADAIAWVAPAAPDEPPRWRTTFTVADRDRTVEDAERLGARVLAQDDTQWTRTAVIKDPQGAEFTASQFTPPTG